NLKPSLAQERADCSCGPTWAASLAYLFLLWFAVETEKEKIIIGAAVPKITHAIINIGLLLEAIRRKGFSGFSDAAAHCQTSAKNFNKLVRGEIPRLDALQRICKGLGITESQLIVGMVKSKQEPAEVVEIKKAGNRG